MPCNAIATVAGRLPVSPALIWEGEGAAHEAALRRLTEAAGINIWGLYRVDNIRLSTCYGDIIIRPDGTITAPATIAATMNQVITSYISTLARVKAITALRALGRITAEQPLPGGAYMVSLEV